MKRIGQKEEPDWQKKQRLEQQEALDMGRGRLLAEGYVQTENDQIQSSHWQHLLPDVGGGDAAFHQPFPLGLGFPTSSSSSSVCTSINMQSSTQLPVSISADRSEFPSLFTGLSEKKANKIQNKFKENDFDDESELKKALIMVAGGVNNTEEMETALVNNFDFSSFDAEIIVKSLFPPPDPFFKITSANQFAKPVSECVCEDLPNKNFVGVDELCHEAMQLINEHFCSEFDPDSRPPPLVISRLSRGGKTTFLKKLFGELKAKNDIDPIFISFHGKVNGLPGLSQSLSILHMIAIQLTNPEEVGERKIICNEKILNEYLATGGKKIVLLIDELNVLGTSPDNNSYPTLDADASSVLKRLFLDKPNRYLVFSTHVPMSVEPLHHLSTRGYTYLSPSITFDLSLLRDIDKRCSDLSQIDVVTCGGIPSLLCTLKNTSYDYLKQLFEFRASILSFHQTHLHDFLLSVMTGELKTSILDYAAFGMVSRYQETFRILWPLCYICYILEAFAKKIDSIESAVDGITKCYHKLRRAGYRSGGWWEGIVHIAILINCLLSQIHPKYSPFDLYTTPVSQVVYLSIPPGIHKLEDLKVEIDEELALHEKRPLVLVATPNHAQFEKVDGIIVHSEDFQVTNVKYYGYQMKEGYEYPDNLEIPNWMTACILLQGNAPIAKGRRQDLKWFYPKRSIIEKFLGASLTPTFLAKIQQLASADVGANDG